jgi:hypothetical protein
VATCQKNVPVPYADGEEELARLVEGGLRPVVDRVVPLEGTADGMAALLNREITGRAVITPRLYAKTPEGERTRRLIVPGGGVPSGYLGPR